MNTFLLEIITPQRRAFSEEVDAITVPTSGGSVGVLSRHEPLFTVLSEGEIKITNHKKEYFLAIGGGFMEVVHNHVSILVSRAVHADELNEAEIKRAMESAKNALKSKGEGADLSHAQAVLRRSVLELKVLGRRKRHVNPTFPTTELPM